MPRAVGSLHRPQSGRQSNASPGSSIANGVNQTALADSGGAKQRRECSRLRLRLTLSPPRSRKHGHSARDLHRLGDDLLDQSDDLRGFLLCGGGIVNSNRKRD